MAEWLEDLQPQGTQSHPSAVSELCFWCLDSAWVGPRHQQFWDMNNHRQSPLAEGRDRKEVGAEAQGALRGLTERKGRASMVRAMEKC